MSIWNRGLERMLKVTGTRCQVELTTGDNLEFYGVFDKENSLETTDGLSVVIVGSVLTVAAAVAKKLERHSAITLYISENEDLAQTWYVREVLYTGDGETARVSIVEKVGDVEC